MKALRFGKPGSSDVAMGLVITAMSADVIDSEINESRDAIRGYYRDNGRNFKLLTITITVADELRGGFESRFAALLSEPDIARIVAQVEHEVEYLEAPKSGASGGRPWWKFW